MWSSVRILRPGKRAQQRKLGEEPMRVLWVVSCEVECGDVHQAKAWRQLPPAGGQQHYIQVGETLLVIPCKSCSISKHGV